MMHKRNLIEDNRRADHLSFLYYLPCVLHNRIRELSLYL